MTNTKHEHRRSDSPKSTGVDGTKRPVDSLAKLAVDLTALVAGSAMAIWLAWRALIE